MLIEIRNRGRKIPLHGIRVLGLSVKQSAGKIGQFGTGLKEAIALLTRMNVSFNIYSGLCKYEFKIMSAHGVDEIGYRMSMAQGDYKADKWYGLGIHPNFGKFDWNTGWQALREFVCNAVDEGNHTVALHDTVVPSEDDTVIAIEATPALLEAFVLTEKRIIALKEIPFVYNNTDYTVYAKSAIGLGEGLQIFHKGVWIQESKRPSLFDYEIKNLKLTESRSADWYTVHRECTIALCYIGYAQCLDFFQYVQRYAESWHTTAESECDFYVFGHYGVKNENWKVAFKNLYGPKAVACPNDSMLLSLIEQEGYLPIRMPAEVYSAMGRVGVPTMTSVLSELQQQAISILPDRVPQSFDPIWASLSARSITNKPKPKVHVYKQDGNMDSRKGFVMHNQIYVNANVLGSHEEIQCVIEEIAHYLSGEGDATRGFQNYFIGVVAQLLGYQKGSDNGSIHSDRDGDTGSAVAHSQQGASRAKLRRRT